MPPTIRAAENRLAGIFPKWVKTIALVAPASPGPSIQKVDEAIGLLTEAGIKVKVMPNAREGEPAGYTSIPAKKRVADLEQAWLDTEVDLILCIRGGVGTIDIVDKLDWEKLRTRPNLPVLGFSDITVLHMAMLKEKVGHPYASASLLALPIIDNDSLKSIQSVLNAQSPEPVKLTPLRTGKASGVALAGHLRLLDTVSRTRFRPETQGKVIFIESPDLAPAEAEKTLQNLRESGFFDSCAAVVFGRLSNCGEHEEIVMRDFAGKVKCPVYMGFPYSHTPRNQMIDLRGEITIDDKGWLRR
ncbi:MAG: LD-carboxypeptidase [Victivallales bacterium]|nr:LD-carboxypeptidase [Victivallales bacterium]